MKISESSGNVFADLGLRNPESLKRKSVLMMQMEAHIRRLGLSPAEFSLRVRSPEAKVAAMRRGLFHVIAERKMQECLRRLDEEA